MSQAPDPKQANPPADGELRLLLERAERGDLSVLPRLRAFLEGRPDVWQQIGDLGRHAEESLLTLLANNNLLLREAVARKLRDLKEELAGPLPSALESLLVQRVGVSWLQAHQADLDAVAAQGVGQGATPRSEYAQRRLDRAQRRYLLSIKALVPIRKLLIPPLSPLELAGRAVNETRGPAAGTRRNATHPAPAATPPTPQGRAGGELTQAGVPVVPAPRTEFLP